MNTGFLLLMYDVSMQKMDILRKRVEELYISGDPNADAWIDWAYSNHVLVVANLTERIAKTHGANAELAVAGALLHDIADAVMPRSTAEHQAESLRLAEKLLQECGFNTGDTEFIVNEVIKPHGCNELMPTTLEGKAMATADGASHFLTDFFLVFCWRHYGPKDDYQAFKDWMRVKIEKHYTKKLFFEDIRQEVRPRYEALKLIFAE